MSLACALSSKRGSICWVGKRCLSLYSHFAVAALKFSALAPEDCHASKRGKRDGHKRKRKQWSVIAGFRKSEWPGCGFVGAFAVRSVGCIGVFGIGGKLLYLRDGRYVV